MTEDNFLKHKTWDVFTFGLPPSAIDLMLKVKGMDFESTFKNSVYFEESGLKIRTINKQDLRSAKTAANRPKDVNDLENLI